MSNKQWRILHEDIGMLEGYYMIFSLIHRLLSNKHGLELLRGWEKSKMASKKVTNYVKFICSLPWS